MPRFVRSMARPTLLLFLVTLLFTLSLAEIRSDSRAIIPSRSSASPTLAASSPTSPALPYPNPGLDRSKLGFFICTRDAWMHVIQQFEAGDITCAHQSDIVKPVFTSNNLKSLPTRNPSPPSLTNRCQPVYPRLRQLPRDIKVTMDVTSSMNNLERNENRDYLSAGRTVLSRVLFFLYRIYFALAGLWIHVLYKKRLTAFRIHCFILAVILLKALNLLFEAEDKSYIKKTGSAPWWDVLFTSSAS